jgi:hypothetical protein
MKDWANLGVAFACGLAVGFALSAFFFGARIRFYKQYIEHRLAFINRLYLQGTATRPAPRVSFWKSILGRRSKQDEGSKSIHD